MFKGSDLIEYNNRVDLPTGVKSFTLTKINQAAQYWISGQRVPKYILADTKW
jgi:hypothetical protein